MAFNFPNNPSNNQVHTENGVSFKWDNAADIWRRQSNTGAQGPTGSPGSPGAQGAQGAPGSPGAPGAQGAQGAPGTVGAQGAQGAPGAAGAQGSPGSAGAQGSDGNFGGVTFDYTYLTDNADSDPGDGKLKFNGTALHTTSPVSYTHLTLPTILLV